MENVRKHRNIKLALEPNYHTTKFFSGSLLTIEMN